MNYNNLTSFVEKSFLKLTSASEIIEKYKPLLSKEKYQKLVTKYPNKNNFSLIDVKIIKNHFFKQYRKVDITNFKNGEYEIIVYTPCIADHYTVKVENKEVLCLKSRGGYRMDGDCESEWDEFIKYFEK